MENHPVSLRVLRFASLFALFIMILPLGSIITHQSEDAQILQRYSVSYFAFTIVYLSLLGALLLAAIFMPAIWARFGYRGRRLPVPAAEFLWWIALVASLAFLIFVYNLAQRWSPGREPLFQVALLALFGWINIFIFYLWGTKRTANTIVSILIGAFSILISLVLIEVFLRRVPGLIPSPVVLDAPGGGRYLRKSNYLLDYPIRVGYRFTPMQDRWIQFDQDETGIEGIQGIVGPRQDVQGQKQLLHFVTDENGFLNTPPVNGVDFDVVILGDSFLGRSAEVHIVDEFSKVTGFKTLNLSNSGWGTQTQVEALKLFGVDKEPDWVVLAYFEGNDLWDVVRYEEKKASGLDWIESDIQSASFWDKLIVPRLVNYGAKLVKNRLYPPDYAYPIHLDLGNQDLELAFTSQYVGVLTTTRSQVEQSHNFELVKRAILEAKEISQSMNARFLLVYFPSEPHVYLPYIDSPQVLADITRDAPSIQLNDKSILEMVPRPPDPLLLKQNLDGQVQAVSSFAVENDIDFLDLTPYFQEKAKEGIELYNYSDTHWNNAGHTLAAQILANYITK